MEVTGSRTKEIHLSDNECKRITIVRLYKMLDGVDWGDRVDIDDDGYLHKYIDCRTFEDDVVVREATPTDFLVVQTLKILGH